VGFEVSDEFAVFVGLHGIPLQVERGVKKLVVDSPCQWRDEEKKRCLHYEQRPRICKDYLCEKARD
jgi:Fe-S-cluster containining protein